MRVYLVTLVLILGACGGDEEPPAAQPKPPSSGSAATKPGQAKKGPAPKDLKPRLRVEDRVSCPTPSDAKECDAKSLLCPAGQYCLAAAAKYYCGPCPERDAIRHTFKPRDFAGQDIRDPFQSYVIAQFGIPTQEKDPERTQKCTRKDQFVAESSNYQSLKIIGIVSQGTQRKVLLTDGRVGHIVKKGDCVGKERAVVKDIGAGYVTFSIEASQGKEAVDYSIQLYPAQVVPSNPDAIDPGAASAPMVPSPSNVPSPAPTTNAPPQPQPGTTTTIIQDKPQGGTITVPPPPQAPTQMKP